MLPESNGILIYSHLKGARNLKENNFLPHFQVVISYHSIFQYKSLDLTQNFHAKIKIEETNFIRFQIVVGLLCAVGTLIVGATFHAVRSSDISGNQVGFLLSLFLSDF